MSSELKKGRTLGGLSSAGKVTGKPWRSGPSPGEVLYDPPQGQKSLPSWEGRAVAPPHPTPPHPPPLCSLRNSRSFLLTLGERSWSEIWVSFYCLFFKCILLYHGQRWLVDGLLVRAVVL